MSHLIKFIEAGMVEITHLIAEKKLEKVVSEYKAGLERSSEYKSKLGDGFSYNEIKAGMAYAKWLEEQGQL